MQNWTPDLSAEAGPKYLAIAAILSRDIEAGRLKPGDRLPPQRVLADRLSIDLTTVTKAYNEVRRQGLIEGGGRLGSFVRAPAAAIEEVPVDTGMNLPPEPVGSILADQIRTGMIGLLSGPGATARLRYQPSGGAPADRISAADELCRRGIETSPDMVLITSGGQNALHAIVGSQFSAGDAVCTGPFVYPGFLSVARRHGVAIVPIAADREGVDPAALEAACRERAIKAVYVVPTNDNPTTATMGEGRRRAIADIADQYGLMIIEDDAYGRLPADPLPAIASFAPDQTWHIASTSKILSPALRVAWLRAPSVKQAWRMASDIHDTIVMAPPLNATLVSNWLRDGSFAQMIDEVRQEARARQRIVREVLADIPYGAHPEGYHLWVPLPERAPISDIVNALRPAGLSAVPSEAFAADEAVLRPALRLSIGGAISRDRLRQTLHILDALIDQRDPRKTPVV